MKTIVKADLLIAMEKTLQEYKDKKHFINVSDCFLCHIFHEYKYWNDKSGLHTCQDCPMYIFKLHHIYPCMDRRCEPIDCLGEKSLLKLRVVKEYYKRIIAKVNEISEEDLNKENAFQFLMDIDNEIADKHKVGMRIKKERLEAKKEVPADEY